MVFAHRNHYEFGPLVFGRFIDQKTHCPQFSLPMCHSGVFLSSVVSPAVFFSLSSDVLPWDLPSDVLPGDFPSDVSPGDFPSDVSSWDFPFF